MGTSWPEKLSPTSRETLMRKLVEGQEFATQLQFLLKKSYGDDHSRRHLSADELVFNIMRSFTESLSTLGSSNDSGEVCPRDPVASSQVDSASCDDRRPEDSGESKNKKRASAKDRRGCYKRKKNSHSWSIISPSIEDSHAWRKYGQKEILNSKYPRSYFRCTRKYDQGCKATKQVQKMEDDPQMFHITYIGQHTCREILKVPQVIRGSDPWASYTDGSDSKIAISMEQDRPFTLSTPTSTVVVKQEYSCSKEEAPASDVTDNFVSPLDAMMWKELTPFETADSYLRAAVPSVYECTEATSHSLDMDFAVKSMSFDNEFHFDDGEFLSGYS